MRNARKNSILVVIYSPKKFDEMENALGRHSPFGLSRFAVHSMNSEIF
jgi:hypothetical protein